MLDIHIVALLAGLHQRGEGQAHWMRSAVAWGWWRSGLILALAVGIALAVIA